MFGKSTNKNNSVGKGLRIVGQVIEVKYEWRNEQVQRDMHDIKKILSKMYSNDTKGKIYQRMW